MRTHRFASIIHWTSKSTIEVTEFGYFDAFWHESTHQKSDNEMVRKWILKLIRAKESETKVSILNGCLGLLSSLTSKVAASLQRAVVVL
jgi:hypothetical protein